MDMIPRISRAQVFDALRCFEISMPSINLVEKIPIVLWQIYLATKPY